MLQFLQEKKPCNEDSCDGVWSPWGDYNSCTKNCNSGTKRRTRRCQNPHNGADCPGDDKEEEVCNTQPCPVDGGWGPWGEYTACDRNCGGETKSRTRLCMTEQGKV